jgi:hypothetical protein
MKVTHQHKGSDAVIDGAYCQKCKASVHKDLVAKLHPRRFPGMSPKMAALVGYLLGEPFTEPAVSGLHVTSDRMVLAEHKGEVGANDFIGAFSDLQANWNRLLAAADDLTDAERAMAGDIFVEKVHDHAA